MKKIILVFALFLAITAFAQDFPQKRPQLLLGKELTLEPIHERLKDFYHGYHNFYADARMITVYKKNAYYNTDEAVLAGHTYKVTNVEAVPGENYFRITLQDTATNEALYYKYRESDPSNYLFKVKGGLQLPPDFYCDLITEADNPKTGGKIYGYSEAFVFTLMKSVSPGKTYYLLSLELGKDVVETGKGITLFLKNGKKIEKPGVNVEIDNSRVTPKFKAFTELTPQDIELLTNNPIESFRLFKYDMPMPKLYGDNIRGALGCLLTK